MPRRVEDYASKFATLNLLISIMSFALGLSTLIFLYNMVTSWRGGPRAVANPWRGMTLEWQVSSPPPVFNFDKRADGRRRALRVRRPWRRARDVRADDETSDCGSRRRWRRAGLRIRAGAKRVSGGVLR